MFPRGLLALVPRCAQEDRDAGTRTTGPYGKKNMRTRGQIDRKIETSSRAMSTRCPRAATRSAFRAASLSVRSSSGKLSSFPVSCRKSARCRSGKFGVCPKGIQQIRWKDLPSSGVSRRNIASRIVFPTPPIP